MTTIALVLFILKLTSYIEISWFWVIFPLIADIVSVLAGLLVGAVTASITGSQGKAALATVFSGVAVFVASIYYLIHNIEIL